MNMDKKFQEAVSRLPTHIASVLYAVEDNVQQQVREVTLRVGRPIVLTTGTDTLLLCNDGHTFRRTEPQCGRLTAITPSDISQSVKTLTEYSLHSYRDNIISGFITIKGGHRAGLCGSMSYQGGTATAVNDISSINLRIARQIKGSAAAVVERLYPDKPHSTLIIGSPCSGKTTLLRDMARILAERFKIAVIDERGELAAVHNGIPQNDVGLLSDVLDGYRKGDGMRLAIRSLSPAAIILDEIGGTEDAVAIRESLNAGVAVIATAHADSIDEVMHKPQLIPLIENGFERLILIRATHIVGIFDRNGNAVGGGL